MGWLLLQTLASLLGVLALMVGVLFAVKKWLLGPAARTSSAVPIEVVGHRVLQPKRSIYIIEVMGKRLVIGVSEAGLQTLASFGAGEEDAIPEISYTPATQSHSFVDYLKDNLGFVRPKNGGRR